MIIEQNGQLLIADSYIRRPYALYDDLFENVTVGTYDFTRTFSQSEVLYFRFPNTDMYKIVQRIFDSYYKLIDYTMKTYQRSRGNHGILKVSTLARGKQNFEEDFQKIKNEYFKKCFESDNGVMPLFDGYEYSELGSKTYANEGTRDIRSMIDDISDFTAKSMGIPPALMRGDVEGTEEAVKSLLAFCIDPLCDMLQEEINRKRIGRKEFLQGTKITIDTKAIKHIDLLEVAADVDKLISSGLCSVNDLRRLVGEPEINEEWANKHFITKNYAEAGTQLRETKEEMI